MDNFHFSTAECFENCPARFGFRYRQNIEVLPTDDPANPLILGTAIHRGMEKDMETAIQEYKDWEKDVNNYVFIFSNGKVERKGAYVKELSPLDYDLPIINKALVDRLVKG